MGFVVEAGVHQLWVFCIMSGLTKSPTSTNPSQKTNLVPELKSGNKPPSLAGLPLSQTLYPNGPTPNPNLKRMLSNLADDDPVFQNEKVVITLRNFIG